MPIKGKSGKFNPKFFDPYNKRYDSFQTAFGSLDSKKNDDE